MNTKRLKKQHTGDKKQKALANNGAKEMLRYSLNERLGRTAVIL